MRQKIKEEKQKRGRMRSRRKRQSKEEEEVKKNGRGGQQENDERRRNRKKAMHIFNCRYQQQIISRKLRFSHSQDFLQPGGTEQNHIRPQPEHLTLNAS
jgi:hypothetical protein